MANDRTIRGGIVKSIQPGQVYPVATFFTFINVIIAFHVVNDNKVCGSKAPDTTYPGAVGIQLIDLIRFITENAGWQVEVEGMTTPEPTLPG